MNNTLTNEQQRLINMYIQQYNVTNSHIDNLLDMLEDIRSNIFNILSANQPRGTRPIRPTRTSRQNNIYYDYLTNKSRFLNLERSLLETYKNNKIINKIKRVKQTQFCVALSTDQTRWKKADRYMLGSNALLIKYQKEYYRALKNKYGLIVGSILRSIFYFKKYFNR